MAAKRKMTIFPVRYDGDHKINHIVFMLGGYDDVDLCTCQMVEGELKSEIQNGRQEAVSPNFST